MKLIAFYLIVLVLGWLVVVLWTRCCFALTKWMKGGAK
jgi:hypothetical protein